MSSDNLKKVFKPFFKIENIIMGDSGLGLGLSLVDAIVTQMRGSIDIMSEEGSGTKVKVKIPNIRIIEGLKNNENTTYKQFNGEIVAIIDENKFSKDHLRSVLEDFNLKVVTFSSIEEFSGYISFSEANLVFIQRELSTYTQFVHLKMFPLKEVPTLKILLNQTKLEDSIYTYDDPLNIYMKVFNNIKTSMEKVRFKPLEKLKVKNIEELIKKIDLIQIDYQRLKDLMEINQIEEFASKIKKMSEEHNVSELENWADELIIKTTNFEIDSIEDLLDQYLIIVRELK
ncbi:MAG: ATP-binding protein, partial [Bdellovibrionota bacterium]|nr:ATP-binding protein [Bdellovibrionota bacterium]